MKGRWMLLVVLLYFSIDLSVPEIPGAFMFEADDSVEISMTNASETKLEISVMPALVRNSFVVSQPPIDRHDYLGMPLGDAHRGRPARLQLPRAILDPAPLSEDPH